MVVTVVADLPSFEVYLFDKSTKPKLKYENGLSVKIKKQNKAFSSCILHSDKIVHFLFNKIYVLPEKEYFMSCVEQVQNSFEDNIEQKYFILVAVGDRVDTIYRKIKKFVFINIYLLFVRYILLLSRYPWTILLASGLLSVLSIICSLTLQQLPDFNDPQEVRNTFYQKNIFYNKFSWSLKICESQVLNMKVT